MDQTRLVLILTEVSRRQRGLTRNAELRWVSLQQDHPLAASSSHHACAFDSKGGLWLGGAYLRFPDTCAHHFRKYHCALPDPANEASVYTDGFHPSFEGTHFSALDIGNFLFLL